MVVDGARFASGAAHVADPSVGIAVGLGTALRATGVAASRGDTAIARAHGSTRAVSISRTFYTGTRGHLADCANGAVAIFVTKRAIATATFDALVAELTVVFREAFHTGVTREVTGEPKRTVGSRLTGLGRVVG